jgi:hypothetical protein
MPTLNLQTAAADDDASERTDNLSFSANNTFGCAISNATTSSNSWIHGVRFTGASALENATINSATTQFRSYWGSSAYGMNSKFGFHDVDDSVDFASNADIHGRWNTDGVASTGDWDDSTFCDVDETDYSGPDCVAALEALQTNGRSMSSIMFIARGEQGVSPYYTNKVHTYQTDSTYAMKLDVDYTPPPGSPFVHYARSR